jgi:exosortase
MYLFWNDREKIFKYVESSLLSAALFAAIASGGVFLARHYAAILNQNDYLSLTAFSFCFFLMAIFLATFGKEAAVSARFPLAMLLFFVPLPFGVAQKVIVALQNGSAVLVYWFFLLLRVPVLREGFVFTVPGASIEIATECSGINSSVALLITALLVAHSTLRKTSSRVLFVLMSLPLSIVKNAIRIVTLTLLATHLDMSFLTGKLHHRGGFVFFLLTLALMVPVWKVIKKLEEGFFVKGNLTSPASAVPSSPAS